MNDRKIKLGVIGCGYWGPNLIRNFDSLTNCDVIKAADTSIGRQQFVKKEFPQVNILSDYSDILNDSEIDAVCIATPVKTHSKIAIQALEAGKHVFVEKPMTSSVEEADKMLEKSIQTGKKIAVGHVFQFAPAVRKIKEMIDSGIIGKVFHITSTRINLGPPKTEVDVVWDLGPHDFSILLYILGAFPEDIRSFNNYYPFGFSINDEKKLVNNSQIHLTFKSGITANIHLS